MNSENSTVYIAGAWSEDKAAIEKLMEWNSDYRYGLHFVDAHSITQARDTSLSCSIKKSLWTRLSASKVFALVVSANTQSVRAGQCGYCASYNSWTHHCARDHSAQSESFVEYECRKAVELGLRIVVLYNGLLVNEMFCPEILRGKGTHLAMLTKDPFRGICWDYQRVSSEIRHALYGVYF